jgi:hypothetical protein
VANAILKWAVQSFKNYFGDVIVKEDIEKIDHLQTKYPDFDIFLEDSLVMTFLSYEATGLEGTRGKSL